LINNVALDVQIVNIYIDWIDTPSDQKLDKIKFGGDDIWPGDSTSPPTNVSGGWHSDANRRVLEGNNVETLEFDFGKNLVPYGISITVDFDLGCSVSVNIPMPTNTPNVTETPTPTLTSTPTPTPTPTPSCSVSTGALTFNNDKMLWTLINMASNDVQIVAIKIDWVDSPLNQKLDKIKLDGAEIWPGDAETPPTSISSGWHSDGNRRILEGDNIEILEFDFGQNLVTSGISITVVFDLGCSISY